MKEIEKIAITFAKDKNSDPDEIYVFPLEEIVEHGVEQDYYKGFMRIIAIEQDEE